MNLTCIAVTRANIFTSNRSSMGHPFAFIAIRTLSYHFILPKEDKIRVFGITLSPDYFWRKISKSVSCYAFFEWWLLLSQHPDCLRNLTSFLALSVNLGTLDGDLGCFPCDRWSFAPTV